MAEYQRLNFRQKFYDKVSSYLDEHPEEGFEPDEVKQFIKFITNKYIQGEIGVSEQQVLEDLKSMMNED